MRELPRRVQNGCSAVSGPFLIAPQPAGVHPALVGISLRLRMARVVAVETTKGRRKSRRREWGNWDGRMGVRRESQGEVDE